MKYFDYNYFNTIEDIKKFANSNNVTIVSILPYNGYCWAYIVCYYKNEQTNNKDSL